MIWDLNQEQLEAIGHGTGPALVVAGAGTGKTSVIVGRIARLIKEHKAKPSQILALTFTDKAAREMEDRLVEEVGYLYDSRVMTFNAYGQDLLARRGLEMGLTPDIVLLSESQQYVFIKDNFDAFKLQYFAPLSTPEKYISELIRFFSKLKSELISPEDYQKYADKVSRSASSPAEELETKRQQELAFAYQTYSRLCLERGLIDFDDQINLAIRLFDDRANLLEAEQAEISYILVDEFQDTNRAQVKLLERLGGKTANLMVVGDDDQSIYRFRGAAIANVLAFAKRYPQAARFSLRQNYRSTQLILDAAYRLIQHNNPDRLEVAERINKHLIGHSTGRSPDVVIQPSYDLEADWLAKDIVARAKAGTKYADMAVLIRQNRQADKLIPALLRQNLPFRVIGQAGSLYRQPEVEVVLNCFKVLANPSDSASLYHLLANPPYAWELRQLLGWSAEARRSNRSLEQLIRETEPSEPITQLIGQLDGWRSLMAERTVGQLGFEFMDQTGYLKHLVSRARQDPRDELSIANLNRFFKTLAEYEAVAADRSVVGFVNDLPGLGDSLEVTDPGEFDPFADEVQILTIHKAKGLEFAVVYIFDLVQDTLPSRSRAEGLEVPVGLLPTEDQTGSNWHLAEERRLMYVAMTRTKNELIMTFSPDHGGRQARKPSQFIEEATGMSVRTTPDRPASRIEQIELFRYRDPKPQLAPRFWLGDHLALSVRQIEDYLMCPAEFRWRHILEVPQPMNSTMLYGTIIHQVIQQYHTWRKQGKVSLRQLLSLVESKWRHDGFISAGHDQRSFDQAKMAISRFYDREESGQSHPKLVERPFKFVLPKLKVVVSGRFDAVYDDKSGVEIRDYKTGAYGIADQAKADRKTAESLQLAVYALAWQRQTGHLPARVSLDFIDIGLTGTAVKNPAQIEKLIDKISQVADGIRRGDFRPASSHLYCTHTGLYDEQDA